MNPDTSRIASTLSEKFESLHQAFIELNSEAADFQRDLHLDDTTSRGQFEALSRTLAFCDQMHLVLTLMREDIRSIDALPADNLASLWTDQPDECLEEWLRTACLGNLTIH